MKKTAVEKLADELEEVYFSGPRMESVRTATLRLAKHVLAREARARGRTVGWLDVTLTDRGRIDKMIGPYDRRGTGRRYFAEEQLARVVLVRPSRRPGGGRGRRS